MKKFILRIFFCSFCCLFFSCTRHSEAFFREQSRSKIEELIVTLQTVEILDDLIQQRMQVTALYDELVDLMIKSRLYQQKTGYTWEMSSEEVDLSQALSNELYRVYQLPGARQLLEKYQMLALMRLDGFERKLARVSSK